MQRMWINQPSTCQPHHELHGTNVLVEDQKSGHAFRRVWFLEGALINSMVVGTALSPGWRIEPPAPADEPIDLENPPEDLVTNEDRPARVVGKIKKRDGERYIIAVRSKNSDEEIVYHANRHGQVNMLSVKYLKQRARVTKTGWVNLYKESGAPMPDYTVSKTKEEALNNPLPRRELLDTVQITWEE